MDSGEEVKQLLSQLKNYDRASANSTKLPIALSIIDSFKELFDKGDFALQQSLGVATLDDGDLEGDMIEATRKGEAAAAIVSEYTDLLMQKFRYAMKKIFSDLLEAQTSDVYARERVTSSLLKLSNVKNFYGTPWLLPTLDSTESERNYFRKLMITVEEIVETKGSSVPWNPEETGRKLNVEMIVVILCSFFNPSAVKQVQGMLVDLINERLDLKYLVLLSCYHLIILKELVEEKKDTNESSWEVLPFYLHPVINSTASQFCKLLFALLSEIEPVVYTKELVNEKENYFVRKSTKIKASVLNDLQVQLWRTLACSPLIPVPMTPKLITHLTQRVLGNIKEPLLFADFFTSCVNPTALGVDSLTPIVALEGLFELMTKHKLDYPRFYERLYQLCGYDLHSHSKNCEDITKFFTILDVCLSSKYLSASLVASFAKRLAQKALRAPPNVIVLTCVLIHNLIVRHPSCFVMVHRPEEGVSGEAAPASELFLQRKRRIQRIRQGTKRLVAQINDSAADLIEDPAKSLGLSGSKRSVSGCEDSFLPDEERPLHTRALESSLWELSVLKNHYSAAVKTVVQSVIFDEFTHSIKTKKFEQPIDMDRFIGMNYETLLTKELNQKGEKRKLSHNDPAEQTMKRLALYYPMAIRKTEDICAELNKDEFILGF